MISALVGGGSVGLTTLVSDNARFLTLCSRLQAKSCVCHVCGIHLNRLHSCLHCVFFGCFTKKHIHEHAKSKRHNLGEPPAPALLFPELWLAAALFPGMG